MPFHGFFKPTELSLVNKTPPLLPQCGSCGLYKSCKSQKIPVTGKGRKKILVVGGYPGVEEDQAGKNFVGRFGRELEEIFLKYGVELRRDCWLTNALICHPTQDEFPEKAILYCRPNLLKTIRDLNPEVIILLGADAVKSLVGHLWREDTGGVMKWAGFRIPCQKLNAWICPTYLGTRMGGEDSPVMRIYYEDHLRRALKLRGRPWKQVPTWEKQVVKIYSPEDAATSVRSFMTGEGKTPVAFDFECNSLRPEREETQIVCCSLSDGFATIAFPWHGEAIIAMREFLESPVPKIAANLKYEDRWVRSKLGIRVSNWAFDTMIASHVLDNRRGVNGLKFQGFALLGMPPYDERISPWLKAEGANSLNRIKEVDLDSLLKYCALDSLLEWKIAHLQAKKLGMEIK